MKKIFTLVIGSAFICIASVNAQSVANQGNIWYFNFNCGLDFTSGVPVSLNNGALNTNEGCTSICDSNSNLLFYTNGVTVYNANHTVMVNGNGLSGGISASQSCVAVRQPGSSTIWYLFTAGESGSGAYYSIIDMSLQGGLGEVTTQNVPLLTPVDEKVTATLQANGTDYWILYHSYTNSDFYAYPLTNSGVGAEVISSTGTPSNYFVGCMKFSPDGNKVAYALYQHQSFQVFDFDKSTGQLTYAFTLSFGSDFHSYGVEWSRDSKHLFIGNVDTFNGQIYEADMTLADSTSIIANIYTIVNTTNDLFGTLQMAPDGKIYVNRYNTTDVGVINNPDSLGAAVDYVANGVSTSPHYNYLGLPNYVTSWFATDLLPPPPSPVAVNATDTDICEKFCIDFHDSTANNPTSWQWSFPGGNPSTSADQNPTGICYNVPGIYDVTVITTNAGGSDTLTLAGYITVYSNPFAPVITQTGNTLTSSPATSYQWQYNSVDIPGATNQTYDITQSGLYTVIIGDDNGCTAQASVDASYVGIDEVNGAGISVYPNPVTDGLMVIWLDGFVKGDFSLSLVNALGQIVFSSEEKYTPGKKKEIDLGDIASGAYFLEVKSQQVYVKKKIVVAR